MLAMPIILHARGAGASPISVEVGRVYDGDFASSVWRGKERLDGVAPSGRTVVPAASGDRVALRRLVRSRVISIDSRSNANDQYVIEVELLDTVKGEAWMIDTMGLPMRASGTTYDLRKTTAWFTVDRALADVLAAASKLPRRDRVRHGEGVIGRWRVVQPPPKLGAPIEIEVEIKNAGARPATITFGPLASSFAFAVTRDQVALPAVQLTFTGPMGLRTLAPGEAFMLAADLRAFANIDRPGTYDVACTFHAEAVPGETFARRVSEAWDLPLQGAVQVRVE